jgi:predicted small metal-binding protein
MAWVVDCECGETVRADDEDGVVQGVTSHVEARHPDLVGTMSRDDVLAMAERV